MTNPDERVFPARRDSLAAAAAFVEDFCAQHGVAHADAMRLTLVVEELFTNTIMHGHGSDCDAPVRVALVLMQEQVVLHYEDCAPPFDPRQGQGAKVSHLDTMPEERKVGGLGVHLVVQMAHRLEYSFDDGRNRLRIALLRQA
jgi:serine/threonine-protein kinase RsbW